MRPLEANDRNDSAPARWCALCGATPERQPGTIDGEPCPTCGDFVEPPALEAHLPDHLAPWATIAAEAGARYGVDPLLLLAIIDRESRGGLALHPPGPGGTGDGGHGRGLMQIDDRWHATWVHTHDWRDPAVNVGKGAEILAGCMAEFPRALSSAVAAYNCGGRNVRAALLDGYDCDRRTTGRNYSADVLRRRASYLKEPKP